MSDKDPWYSWHIADGLNGMRRLNLEERGAYRTILDLIYDHGGPLPFEIDNIDDVRDMARELRASTRKTRSIIIALVFDHEDKLYLKNGTLGNLRADFELEKMQTLAKLRSEAGSKGAQKKAEYAKKRNEIIEDKAAKISANGMADSKLLHYSTLHTHTVKSSKSEISTGDQKSTSPPDDLGVRELFDRCISLVGNKAAPNLELAPLETLFAVQNRYSLTQPQLLDYVERAAMQAQNTAIGSWKYIARIIETLIDEEKIVGKVLKADDLEEQSAIDTGTITLDDLENGGFLSDEHV